MHLFQLVSTCFNRLFVFCFDASISVAAGDPGHLAHWKKLADLNQALNSVRHSQVAMVTMVDRPIFIDRHEDEMQPISFHQIEIDEV